MTITNERIAELREIAGMCGIGIGGKALTDILDALTESRAEAEGLTKEVAYVRGIMQGQETECRACERQDKVYRFQVTVLENTLRDARAELAALKQGVEVPEIDVPAMQAIANSLTLEEMRDDRESEKIWCAKINASLRANARPVPTPPPLPADKVVVDREEWTTLREIVRLLDEARERNRRRPRGAGGQAMGDEIDDLLCRLYELRAHPGVRAQPTTNEKGE